jgi:hypothetical protein
MIEIAFADPSRQSPAKSNNQINKNEKAPTSVNLRQPHRP